MNSIVKVFQPGTLAYRRYGDWLIKEIQEYTGHLYDIGNLHNETLETLYEHIVGKNPFLTYKKSALIQEGGE